MHQVDLVGGLGWAVELCCGVTSVIFVTTILVCQLNNL